MKRAFHRHPASPQHCGLCQSAMVQRGASSLFLHAYCLSRGNCPQPDLYFFLPSNLITGALPLNPQVRKNWEMRDFSALPDNLHFLPTSPASCLSCRCIFKGCFPACSGEVERVQFFLPSLLQSKP